MLICPAMLYGQKTTTPTLYKHWKINDLKVRSSGKSVPRLMSKEGETRGDILIKSDQIWYV
jgi:hypothetical protein